MNGFKNQIFNVNEQKKQLIWMIFSRRKKNLIFLLQITIKLVRIGLREKIILKIFHKKLISLIHVSMKVKRHLDQGHITWELNFQKEKYRKSGLPINHYNQKKW